MSSLKLVSSSIVVLNILLLPGVTCSTIVPDTLRQKVSQNFEYQDLKSSLITKELLLSKTTPISVKSQDVGTIGIADIQSALPPGTAIGERFCSSALIRKSCGENVLDEMSNPVKTGYKTLIEEELRKTGYSVAGYNESIFSNVTNEAQPTRFLIGATITKAEVHSIESENLFSDRKSWKTKGKVTVRWEVLDRQTNKVIYKKETAGESKVAGKEVNPATYEAARESLKAVLADVEFVVTLRSISANNNLPPTDSLDYNLAEPTTETNTNTHIPIDSSPTQSDTQLPPATPEQESEDWQNQTSQN